MQTKFASLAEARAHFIGLGYETTQDVPDVFARRMRHKETGHLVDLIRVGMLDIKAQEVAGWADPPGTKRRRR